MKHLSIPCLLLAVFTLLFGTASCVVTRHITADNPLYIGMKRTKVSNGDNSAHGEKTLAAVEAAIAASPNNAFFGGVTRIPLFPPVGLWLHDRLVDDSTGFGRWIYRKFASKPILIKSVSPENRAKVGSGILQEHGYFHGSVRSRIIPLKKDSLQAHIRYYVDMGPTFLLDSIGRLPGGYFPDSSALGSWVYRKLKTGNPFDLSALTEERGAISEAMRNEGYYYFRPDIITFEADTFARPGTVLLRPIFTPGLPPGVFTPWRIGQMRVFIPGPQGQSPTDSLSVDGMDIYYYPSGSRRRPIVRPAVIRQRLIFAHGKSYRQTDEDISRQALSRIGAFGSMDFRFTPETPPDSLRNYHLLNLDLLATPDKPWDVSLEMAFKLKSNNYMGPGIRFTLGRRNVFGGGERLSFDVYGSFEWQTGRRPEGSRAVDINSYEVGSSVNLSFPCIVLPKLYYHNYLFPTTTNFQVQTSMLNRAGFFRMFSYGTNVTYDFQPTMRSKHLVTALKINYNLLQHRTEAFREILRENPLLALSLESQLIPQIGYTYSYERFFADKRHYFRMEYGIAEAGNIISGIYRLAGKRFNDTKNILGAPFAQFVRLTAEWRYTYNINRRMSLATRLGTGLIVPYGNMRTAPFSEQFYVGGANSIRAFTVRAIGPGKFIPKHENRFNFIDQTGDVKLEANIEGRFRIMGNLHGAIFLDAGNVWLLRRDENRLGGSVREITGANDFFNQIALGTGAGLRYDLDILVIRFDCGIGLHLPYDTGRGGYYNIPSFRNALGLHLAIGYPF